MRRRDPCSVLRADVTSCEAGDEPLQVRPVRIVGEGEEPGLGAAMTYSITSSALNRMDGGTVSASALAVFKFTAISNFTGT